MKIIAYYLPQFYPFEENNKWWGPGFTEWTNVSKAKKLYFNHYQPKIPRELGFYDLRLIDVQKEQIKLAKEANISAFCYWHYWFGNGKVLLDVPLKLLLENKNLDFPFCLAWANESWKAKVWNNNDSKKDKILIEQKYPGENDIIEHFNYVLKYVSDKRYFTIDNKPVFVIYKPLDIPYLQKFMQIWNELIKKAGIAESFYFIGHTLIKSEYRKLIDLGFDAVNIVRIGEYRYNKKVTKKILLQLFAYKFLNRPLILNYSFISKYFTSDLDKIENVFPTIIPNWDHTPRSGKHGVVFHNSTPELFEKHLRNVFDSIKNKQPDRRIAFLKSWNEWGEGNYIEPDLKFGKAYIHTLHKVYEDYNKDL